MKGLNFEREEKVLRGRGRKGKNSEKERGREKERERERRRVDVYEYRNYSVPNVLSCQSHDFCKQSIKREGNGFEHAFVICF